MLEHKIIVRDFANAINNKFIVRYYNSDGTLLVNSAISQDFTQVVLNKLDFVLNVPINASTINLPNIIVKIYSDNVNSGIFSTKTIQLIDNCITDNCTTNIVINSIVNITNTGITVNYTGGGDIFNWNLKNLANQTIRSGILNKPNSVITFAQVPNNDYILILTGVDCITTAQQLFNLTQLVITTTVIPETLTTTPPTALEKLAVTYDPVSHDASIHILGNALTRVRISAASNPQPNGLTWVTLPNDTSWNKDTYVPGTTEYVQLGYSRIYRMNPINFGIGGIENNKQYYIDVKLQGQNQYYRIIWTTGSSLIFVPYLLFGDTSTTTTVIPSDTLTTTPPLGFTKLAITYNALTHETSLHLNGNSDTLVRVSAATSPQPSGLTWVNSSNDTAWNSTTYLLGTSEYVQSGYTRIYRLNPVVLGEDGIINSKLYYFDIKIAGQNQYYRIEFTTGTSNIVSPQVLYSTSTTTILPLGEGDYIYNPSETPLTIVDTEFFEIS